MPHVKPYYPPAARPGEGPKALTAPPGEGKHIHQLTQDTPPALDLTGLDHDTQLLVHQLTGTDRLVTNCQLQCGTDHPAYHCPKLDPLPPEKQQDIFKAIARKKARDLQVHALHADDPPSTDSAAIDLLDMDTPPSVFP